MSFQEKKQIYLTLKPRFSRAFWKYRLSKSDLDDLYHEGFKAWLEACEKGYFDPNKGKPKDYIFRAAKNILLKKNQKDQKEPTLSEEIREILWFDFPEKGQERREMIDWVKRHFTRILSREEQQILNFFLFDGFSIHQIAERLKTTEGAVKMKKKRALNKLWEPMKVAFNLPEKRLKKK